MKGQRRTCARRREAPRTPVGKRLRLAQKIVQERLRDPILVESRECRLIPSRQLLLASLDEVEEFLQQHLCSQLHRDSFQEVRTRSYFYESS